MKSVQKKPISWEVKHPDFGSVRVDARSEAEAIVAAAAAWGTRWQSLRFYAWCEVYRA